MNRLLEGRKVLVWGDHDQPGQTAQSEICTHLKKLDPIYVREIDHSLLDTFSFPKKWDLADPLPKEAPLWAISTIINDSHPVTGNEQAIDYIEERHHIQEQLLLAQERRMESGEVGLYGEEKLLQSERATVVLCSSPQAADLGDGCFRDPRDHICLSWKTNQEGTIDFSLLEGRKVLVWGELSEQGKQEQDWVCEQLKSLDNVAVRCVDHDLMKENYSLYEGWDLSKPFPEDNTKCGPSTYGWIEDEAEEEIGSWKDIDDQYRKIDLSLGLIRDHSLEMER